MENQTTRVILADTNIQERESRQKALQERGMNVILSTGDGNKVLEALRSRQVDLLIMDLVLPGSDGLSILKELQSMTLRRRPVVMVITAMGMNAMVAQAMQCGADYYLMKPLSNRTLMVRIQELMDLDAVPVTQVAEPVHIACGCLGHVTGDLERDITNILLEIGVPAHIKGYQYIREGIMIAFYDRNMLHYITKYLYPTIAQKYKTTSSSVERTIRHAIEVAWRRGDLKMLEEVFGNTVCSGKGKPTNSEFMALLTDRLLLEYRSRPA